MNIKNFVTRYFNTVLFSSLILGFFVPDFGKYTNYTILALLFGVIFSSFFQIDLSVNTFVVNTRKALIFFCLRCVLLPLAVYFPLSYFNHFFATTVFMLLLLPSAVASPAVTTIFKANINLSVSILLISSFLSIFTIPYFSGIFIETTEPINRMQMFQTLLFTIVLPFVVHLPLRKVDFVNKAMNQYGSLITLLCLASMSLVIISKNKTIFFKDIHLLLIYTAISFAIYSVLYILGWFYFRGKNINENISYSISSGLNNIGLGIALTSIYFPPVYNLFFIIADVVWVIILIPVKYKFNTLAHKAIVNQ